MPFIWATPWSIKCTMVLILLINDKVESHKIDRSQTEGGSLDGQYYRPIVHKHLEESYKFVPGSVYWSYVGLVATHMCREGAISGS